jgi:hypothetical protein
MTENEKSQLRADVSAFLNPQPAAQTLPLPPQANRAALTPIQQQELSENWLQYIYARPQNTWDASEKAAVRAACALALKELNR